MDLQFDSNWIKIDRQNGKPTATGQNNNGKEKNSTMLNPKMLNRIGVCVQFAVQTLF